MDSGTGVSLSASDGRNIATSYAAGSFGASTVADFGLAPAGTTGATVNLDYESPTPAANFVAVLHLWGGAGAGLCLVPSTTRVGTPLSQVDLSTVDGANAALASVDRAIAKVSSNRASLGAAQSRFESTLRSLKALESEVAASRSRILDADLAEETASLARAQVLRQAGTAMITQANQLPQQVLQLLR